MRMFLNVKQEYDALGGAILKSQIPKFKFYPYYRTLCYLVLALAGKPYI